MDHRWSRHWLLIIALLTVVVPAVQPTHAASAVLYDGSLNTTPASQNWLYLFDPISGNSATQTPGNGGVILDTTAAQSDKAGYFKWDAPPQPIPPRPLPFAINRTTGYNVRFDVQVQAENHSSTDRAGFSIIVLDSDNIGIELGFWTDEIWAQNDGATEPPRFTHGEGVAFDTTSSVVRYDLSVLNTMYTLYANQTAVLTGSLRDYSPEGSVYTARNFLFLGDDTTSASARIKLNRVEISDQPVAPPTVAFGTSTASVNEASGTVPLVITRTGDLTQPTTVMVQFSDGSAVAPADYDATPLTATFAASQTSASVNVPIVNDTQAESTEIFTATLVATDSSTIIDTPGSTTITIFDDDAGAPSSTVAFAASTASVNEASGTVPLVITRTGDLTQPTSVTVQFSDGSAVAGSDYDATPLTATFAASQTSASVNVPIADDTQAEATETFTATLTTSDPHTIIGTPNSSSVSIVDDDAATGTATVTLHNFEQNMENFGSALLVAFRTGDLTQPSTVTVQFSDGTATSPADYDATPLTVTFAVNETTVGVSVPIVDDTLVEPTETFTATLVAADGHTVIGTPGSIVVSIVDNDGGFRPYRLYLPLILKQP